MDLQKRLTANEFVILAEMHTPKGINTTKLIDDVQAIKDRIHAIVVPDMDNGIMRMSGIGGGVLIQQQGVETVIHMYCRDRNRMALQGDLLAAHVLGIHNVLVVHSENMEQSDHRDAKTVNDLTELELLGAMTSLNSGEDMGGFELDGCPTYTAGCTIAPFENESELDAELVSAREKIIAGASFIITPPLYDTTGIDDSLTKMAGLGVPVIPTVFLIKSLAIAQYISNSEPTASISKDLIKRIRKSPDREQEGINIAGETIAALQGKSQGVMIQTLGWENKIPAILDAAGLQ